MENEIEQSVEMTSKKYGYDEELSNALKRCVLAMADGRSIEEINVLLSALNRVEIITFDDNPTQEQIDEIKDKKINGRNAHVTFNTSEIGEYGKAKLESGYVTEAIFDQDMNIIDRIGFIYLLNLPNNSKTADFYGTRIDLSHMIHELGHLWGAQNDEYVQDSSGDYVFNVGMAKYKYEVDRNTHTVTQGSVEGIFLEEAVNTVEEEDTLCRLSKIKSLKEIPRFRYSSYQGAMADSIREWMNLLNYSTFRNYRIFRSASDFESLQRYFRQSDFIKQMSDPEYWEEKRAMMNSFLNSSISENSKNRIADFLKRYSGVYFKQGENCGIVPYLDNVMEQFYDFNSIKFQFNVLDPDNLEAYKQMRLPIFMEAYKPIKQMRELLEQNRNIDIQKQSEHDSEHDDEDER